MNILIADDDPVTRLALVRVLQRAIPCTITQVDNGLDALEQLETGSVDLLVLDLVMPQLDGIEVLRIVRSSPDFRDLPVVVVSSVKDERGVADVISLGISDYVTKPLRPERIAERLKKVVQTTPAATHATRKPGGLEPGQPLMVVDANADFRHFFTSVMGARHPVVEVASGVKALKLLRDDPPAALFVGHDIGALPPEMFLRRLRETHALGTTTVVGAWPRGMLDAARACGLFDEVIARTFVPDVLERQLHEVFSRGAAQDAQALMRTLEPRTASAVEQVFGMMLATDLEPVTAPLEPGPAVVSSATLTRPDGQHLTFTVMVPAASARRFAERLLLIDGATDADAVSGVVEVSNVLVDRLHKVLAELGTTTTCGPSEARLLPEPPGASGADGTNLALCFATPAGLPVVRVELAAPA